MNSKSVPQVVNSQPHAAAAPWWLESAMAKERVQLQACVPEGIGTTVLSLKQRCLRRERKPRIASCSQPRSKLVSQISTKWYEPGAAFTWADSEACLLEVHVSDAQSQCFA